jgi:hypothetical protein
MQDVPFSVLAALAALVYALNIFIDNLLGREYASAIKQAKTWVVGVLAVFLGAHVQYTQNMSVGGIAWHQLSLASQLLLGLTGGAFANVGFHLGQRFDTSSSGDTPTVGAKLRRVDRLHKGKAV